MRQWLNLFENNLEDVVLYHVTSSENEESILESGVKSPSYWAIADIADYYEETVNDDGDDAVRFSMNLADFDHSLLEPDHEGISEPVTYSTLGKSEKQVWREWEEAEGTWQDSLRIVGSVRYSGVARPTLVSE